MMGDYHVRFRERFGGETPPYLLDQIYPMSSLHRDIRRTRKSFAALPCNRPCTAKHNLSRFIGMIFCLPGLRHLDNFIMIQKSLPIYLDFTTMTIISLCNNSIRLPFKKATPWHQESTPPWLRLIGNLTEVNCLFDEKRI
jgi:hypothetical protein